MAICLFYKFGENSEQTRNVWLSGRAINDDHFDIRRRRRMKTLVVVVYVITALLTLMV